MNGTAHASPVRPTPLAVIPEGIPSHLKERDHWVVWRYERRKDGRWTKPPYRADGKGRASSTDPASWTTFDAAISAYLDHGWDGIGYALARFVAGHQHEASNDDIVGIDLDHCRDRATDELTAVAAGIVATVDSYAEHSPGGDGLRIFARATLPDGPRKRGNLEVYESGRYFTCTGQHLPGTPSDVRERQAEVEAAYRLMFSSDGRLSDRELLKGPRRTESAAGATRLLITRADRELIDRARSAADGGKFARLWGGDWSSYASLSEADAALCFKLAFWTNRDAARMDSLFRQSGLHRPKWDERHYGDGRTYGQGAIDKANMLVTQVYRPSMGVMLSGRVVQRPDGLRVRRLPPIRRPSGVPARLARRELAG